MATKRATADNENSALALAEGMMTDFITGQPVKGTVNENVSHEVARQLIFEYQIAPASTA